MRISGFDRYASIFFALIGVTFLIESRKIADSAYGSDVGPNVFPFLLGLILILLSIKLFFETLNSQKKERETLEKLEIKRFVIIFAMSVIYASFLETFGYIISTFLFLFISFQAMEKGSLFKNAAISALFSICVYFLFVNILKGSLPGFPVWFN
ncbi:tripartite tricarboxylate transporter TctB family protein [Bacillus sp. NEB1478]|uniref:tripartite tricarboxylate transporter TctB family protein n=1 Tax=Bacillus sp. NEB1478 TaxID=3073816 RepID=UPI002873DFB9|nr:tripartite tricarboxylate transporter TctB family protein [Bacillus sp. NEB1478]WNB93847.1 tripartite tricarboxylate transporter TctB family protein [Bacillus sp. NEB1478]